MSEIGRNIQSLREAKGMSMEQLGEKLGKTRSAVSQYESGKIIPRMGVIEDLSRIFNVSKSVIIGDNVVLSAGYARIPLFGRIAAGQPLEMDDVENFAEVPDVIVARYPDCFCLTVEGNSMDKILPNGCQAVIDPCETVDFDNKPYAVCVNGYDATIKRVRKLERGFELVPDSNDPTFKPKVYDADNPDDEVITIIGRVVYHVIPFDWEY